MESLIVYIFIPLLCYILLAIYILTSKKFESKEGLSKLYYLLPIFLPIFIGGIIGYFLVRKRDIEFARKIHFAGLILLSVYIVTGIISIVAAYITYPISQKNLDITTLNKAEDFLRLLDKKIDKVVVSEKTGEIVFNLPGEISVDPTKNIIKFSLQTSGSIYAPGGFVCFSRNCNLEEGTWGEDSYSVIGVQSDQIEENQVLTTYSIIYRELVAENKEYIRDIVTPENKTLVGKENSKILIEKLGTKTRNNQIVTTIKISIP